MRMAFNSKFLWYNRKKSVFVCMKAWEQRIYCRAKLLLVGLHGKELRVESNE